MAACSEKHTVRDGGVGRDEGAATTDDDGGEAADDAGRRGGARGDASARGEDGDSAVGGGGSAAGDDASAVGGGGDGDAASLDSADGGSGDASALGTARSVRCGDHPCACADGRDNDGDDRADLADPECVSSWDDDEDSFATGMPGDNRDEACQDCFFDGNSGSGNDGCRTPTSCLLTGSPTSGQGSCSRCEQPQRCVDFCRAYTPNGCDCFGCCEVRIAPGDVRHVLLAQGCDLEGTTLEGCTACVPNPRCNNPCGRCELCPGKTEADLPADCAAPAPDGSVASEPPGHTCDDGAVCGEGYPLCPSGALCQFGCCVSTPTL